MPDRLHHPPGIAVACALLLAALVATLVIVMSVRSGSSGDAVAAARGGRANYVFFYQQIDPTRDEAKFHGAAAVVTAGQRDDASAVAAIHNAGAMAIKYVQFYWLPADRTYEGIDIGRRLDWAFCSRGSAPLRGRVANGESWYFFDANEAAARQALFRYLKGLHRFGYDGVFFDRGSPSLRSSTGINMAWRRSTCTQNPVSRNHRRFADVFASVVDQARRDFGFHVYLNYGHPFSGFRLRPDPTDGSCRRHGHQGCRYLDDLNHTLAGVIDESARDVSTPSGLTDELTLDQAEAYAMTSGQPTVIRGIKAPADAKSEAYLRWAIAHLYNLPTFINTGDDGCPAAPCNRNGTYPELTQASLGQPLRGAPTTHDCTVAESSECLWARSYEDGIVIVNGTNQAIADTIRIRSGCQRVTNVYQGSTSGDCLSSFQALLPAHSGRVYTYAGN
jgi:hypothetical protein